MKFVPLSQVSEGEEDGGVQTEGLKFVPLQPEVAVAPTPEASPAKEGFLDALGTGMNAVRDWATGVPITAADRKGSVLQSTPAAPLPTEDKMLQPQFVQGIQAKLDAMPEAQRTAELDKMAQRPDAYGRAAKVIAGRYESLNKVIAPTLQKFDPRLEAQKARLVEQGLRPDIAEGYAQQGALTGELQPDMAQITEAPPEYAEAEPYRVKKGLTGIAEFGQTVTRGGKKAGLAYEQGVRGVNQFVGDTLGFDMSTNKARLDSINQFTASMGEQSSKPLSLIEGAITSIGQQAPALIGGVLTGSEPAILGAMFAQSFGQTYDEGKRKGLDAADNTTRSAMYAALEVLGEKFGLGDKIKGIKAAAKGLPSDKIASFFAKSLVKEVPGEELTYAGQFAVDKGYGMNPEAGIADFISGAADTLAATVIQGGMMAGAGVAAGKGVGKLQEMRDKIQTEQRQAYVQDKSYEGMSSLIAKGKGFNFVPLAEAEKQTTEAPIAEAVTPEVPAVAPEREAKVKELASKIEARTGASEEDALAIAERRVAQEEEVKNEPEPIAGEAVSGEPVAEADRTGAAMAEQSGEAPAAAGVEAVEPGTVVPAGPAVEGPAVGEGPEPAALTEEKKDKLTTNIYGKPWTYFYPGAEVAQDRYPGAPAKVVAVEEPPRGSQAHTTYTLEVDVSQHPEGEDENGNRVATKTVRVSDDELNRSNPPETQEGVPSGDETVEAKQAEAQGQEAPAAGEPQTAVETAADQAREAIKETKKRGRPTLVLTPEQEAAKSTEGKAKRAAYMKATRAVEKQTTALERAVAQANQTNRRIAYKELLKLEPTVRGTPVGKKLKATLEEYRNRFTPVEIETLKREIADEKATALPIVGGTEQVADARFAKFTNASQAAEYIIKTGDGFQKELGKRLRGFVNGVKFVVVEKDGPVPEFLQSGRPAENWVNARGMYVPSQKTIYIRGESFGAGQGVNNEVVLHEMLHAATFQKLKLGQTALRQGFSPNNAVTQATLELQRTMESAKERFDELKAAGKLPAYIAALDKQANVFGNLDEFLAYGMSDDAMQTFLLGAKGREGGAHFFSRFVNSVRNFFNMGKDTVNALSDLILVTDKLLSARKSPTMMFLEAADNRTAAREAQTLSATQVDEEAKKQDKMVIKAGQTVTNSRIGEELGKAVSAMAALRNPVEVWKTLGYVWDGVTDSARSRISNAFDMDAIARGPGEQVPPLRDVSYLMQRMSGMSQSIQRSTAAVSEQIKRFYRANPDARVTFEDLVHASTLAKYDPSKVGAKNRNLALDDAFKSLPKEGRQLYQDLRDYYKDMNELQLHILTENLDKLDLPKENRTKLIAGIREAYQKENLIEPYFPLMRHGDYVLKIGKKGSKSYLSMRFDTKAERERAADRYAESQGETAKELEQIGHITKSEDEGGVQLRRSVESSSAILKAGYAAIDAAPIGYAADPVPIRAAMKDNLYQAYLASMPEGSTRKMFIHREGTAGFSSDVLRNLNVYGSQASKSYSRLKFGTPIRQALESAKQYVVGEDAKYAPFVARAREMAADELEFRPKTGIEQGAEQVADIVTKLSFIRNLTSWSSAMLQPGEIVLKGAPVLVGNHGPAAIPALMRRMKIWNQYGVVQKNPDGTTTWRAPSIEFASGLTPDQRRAVRDMNSMYGVTADTLANDVFAQAKKPGTTVDSKWVANSKDAANTLIMGGLMHHSERLSREVLFLTSYDLYLAEFKAAKLSPESAHSRAVYSAVQEITETLGNYSAYNKPMFMRGATGKLLTMYKFFPLVTTKLLVGNFFRMLPLMNKEGKVAAATKFFGIMGTHLLAGGLTALPLFSVIMGVIGAAWEKWGRDQDAPAEMKDVDFITWWKNEYMQSVFGSTHIADVLKTGVLNKLTGWDIASRLSLNDMWFRELPHSRNLNETAMNVGWVIAGPAASTALDVAKGVQLGMDGEYELALEKMLPASISKLLIANRYATEGVETNRGVQLLEPGKLSAAEIAGQALGFRPAKVAEAQEIAFKVSAGQKAIVENRTKIANDLKDNFRKSMDLDKPESYRDRFDDKFDETLDKRDEFNMKFPENKITDGEVFQMLLEDKKIKANMEINGGIKVTPKDMRIFGDTVDAAIETIESYDKQEQKSNP